VRVVVGPEGYTVGVEVDRIEARSMHADALGRTPRYEPDPTWAHIDERSHLHAWGLDSWHDVEVEPAWIDEDGEEYNARFETQCRECGVRIRPGYRQNGYHEGYVMGPKRMYVLAPDGTRLDLRADEAKVLDEVGVEWLPELLAAVDDHRWYHE
jgi:hypothetical protein